MSSLGELIFGLNSCLQEKFNNLVFDPFFAGGGYNYKLKMFFFYKDDLLQLCELYCIALKKTWSSIILAKHVIRNMQGQKFVFFWFFGWGGDTTTL